MMSAWVRHSVGGRIAQRVGEALAEHRVVLDQQDAQVMVRPGSLAKQSHEGPHGSLAIFRLILAPCILWCSASQDASIGTLAFGGFEMLPSDDRRS